MSLWGCFQKTLAFESVDWVKKIAHPNMGRSYPINWRYEQNKKAELKGTPPPWLLELGCWVFSNLLTQTKILVLLGSWTYCLLDWNLNHYHSWFKPLNLNTIPLALMCLQLANCRFSNFFASISTCANSLQ